MVEDSILTQLSAARAPLAKSAATANRRECIVNDGEMIVQREREAELKGTVEFVDCCVDSKKSGWIQRGTLMNE